jgi:hypothetical protein
MLGGPVPPVINALAARAYNLAACRAHPPLARFCSEVIHPQLNSINNTAIHAYWVSIFREKRGPCLDLDDDVNLDCEPWNREKILFGLFWNTQLTRHILL